MINGYIPAARFLPFLSWTAIAALPDKANTVIVLPTGAIEQHGPHLPCSVDSVISSGVAGHALARLPETIPAYAIPPVTYGKSDEHLNFPGTLTLTGDTLLQTILEIAESLYRAGFRKLLMINGHGGQPQVLQMASREMRLRHGDMIMILTMCSAYPAWKISSSAHRSRRWRCMPVTAKPQSCWRWHRNASTSNRRSPIIRQSSRVRHCRQVALPLPGLLMILVEWRHWRSDRRDR